MSSAAPPGRHLRNHVFIETAESWASVRQIKTIDQSRLGDRIATAGADELEETVEILVQRLASAGSLQTELNADQINAGSLITVDFHDEHGSAQRTEMLVLDYNQGNDIVIAVEVEYRTAPNSPVRIPIDVMDTSQSASALVHRVRSIDVGARSVHRTGAVSGESIMSVGQALLAALDG